MVGGYGNLKQTDNLITELCNSIKNETENQLGKIFDTWKVIEYKTQIVNGTNFKVKVQVSDENFVQLQFHRALPCYGGKITLKNVTEGCTLQSIL